MGKPHTCPTCEGTGRKHGAEAACPTCEGRRVVFEPDQAEESRSADDGSLDLTYTP